MALSSAEDDAGNTIARKAAAKLPEPTTQWATKRQSDRPTHFHQAKVTAKNLPILHRQPFEPVPNRLNTSPRKVENNT
jgi:hypothetical protein